MVDGPQELLGVRTDVARQLLGALPNIDIDKREERSANRMIQGLVRRDLECVPPLVDRKDVLIEHRQTLNDGGHFGLYCSGRSQELIQNMDVSADVRRHQVKQSLGREREATNP